MFLIGTSRATVRSRRACRRGRARCRRSGAVRPEAVAHRRLSAPRRPASRASRAGAPRPSRRRRARRPAADPRYSADCGAPGRLMTTGTSAVRRRAAWCSAWAWTMSGAAAVDAMSAPGGPAEPFLVQVQRRHRQAAETARGSASGRRVARDTANGARSTGSRRSDSAAPPSNSGCPVMMSTSTPERRQLARPRQMPRLAAAAHHREAAHQHRYAHARSRVPVTRSTCGRAQSSRQTSAQIRLA